MCPQRGGVFPQGNFLLCVDKQHRQSHLNSPADAPSNQNQILLKHLEVSGSWMFPASWDDLLQGPSHQKVDLTYWTGYVKSVQLIVKYINKRPPEINLSSPSPPGIFSAGGRLSYINIPRTRLSLPEEVREFSCQGAAHLGISPHFANVWLGKKPLSHL